MGETSPIGATIVFVIGLSLVFWLPLRIRDVWRGEKSAPPMPIPERKKRIFGRKVFDVTDRNFPLSGGAFLFGVGVFAVGLGAEGVFSTILEIHIKAAIMPVVASGIGLGTICGLLAQIMYLTDRPKFLMPPALRDSAVEHDLPSADETEFDESEASVIDDLPDDISVFKRRRERYLRLLQTGSATAFRRDPRMLSFLLDSIEGIDRLFEAYETEPSLEAAYRSLDEETINAILEDALSSIEGTAIIAFESLDLLDISDDDDMTFDEERLRTLGVDPATIDTTTDVYSIDEESLLADYVTVVESLDPELVTVFDDQTITAFRRLELSFDDESDEHIYDIVRSDSFDYGQLDEYANQLERLRSTATLSAFDDEIVGQLAGEVRRLRREIGTSTFDRSSVRFLDDLPADMYETTSLSTTPGGSLILFDDDDPVELALIISKFDDVTLTRWSDDKLRQFEDYFAVHESTVHDDQFEDQLTGRVLTVE
ncbi:hypothetical protein [Halocatena pleomorpha]|uniref:Uncharacterized protein n=1 Tax=Halocatena pleomorpha TaxID=1785090 RepID=A0A3P3RCF9_9EURY|nr:hypothetical protein [Halocatena pleomorpha]RRJ30648.1 hypothetical protein EIK79_09205 [Halocatena pleomorpha]